MKGRSPTVVFLAVVALVLFARGIQAAPITIDFNLPSGTILTNQYLAQGVIFSADDITTATVQAVVYSGPDGDGTVGLESYCGGPGYLRVDFLNLTNYVAADFRLFEGDGALRLELYRADGTLLGSSSIAGANDTWYRLGVATPEMNVSYALLSGVHGYVNAVEFDNLTFEATAVPEPASLLLFGTGLAGLGFCRKRRT